MQKNVLDTNLSGKVAVVTGAGGVLCSAFAKTLARAGAKVALLDLNEEAANMMQYQKAYSAACRLMTTLDEALDKLINGTGVVGL